MVTCMNTKAVTFLKVYGAFFDKSSLDQERFNLVMEACIESLYEELNRRKYEKNPYSE